MGDNRPLDVFDIAGVRERAGRPQHPAMGDHWYWCRKHQRAEHSGWAMDGCVRVGPFMTEREADRLNEGFRRTESGSAARKSALGMEVEK